MKRLFSSLILAISFPIKLFKKTRIDNFVGGLILGAIFSFIVNIVTVQIQENLQRQRVLEGIENEINLNYLGSKDKITQNQTERKDGKYVNFFYNSPNYSADLWTQSAEPMLYVAQLDADIQSNIMLYYSIVIKQGNKMVDRTNKIIEDNYLKCFDSRINLIEKTKTECLETSNLIRDTEDLPASLVYDHSMNLLKIFHPTEDRLNSWIMKLLMGDKSVRILSGK